ncbi:putative NUDIX domain [Rosellinia necatrix]|uniref:Putative NUDIX domain n=1 Tax=Rosellinia necatrix TaxID=77044 RepID=A0A1W2TT33_ROSNE|nr:putative NUDIX domain [Rosellinia necatrix]
MATSRGETEVFTSEQFVESAGTILFRLSTCEICVLHLLQRDEYVLPKGRRNLGESRRTTAIRETTEETGIPCRLLPVNMLSRVCPAIETEQLPDEARLYREICEPIAVQQRRLGDSHLKLTWWFVGAVNEDEPLSHYERDKFEVEFHSYDEALRKLTFRDDRKVVKKAIDIVSTILGV